MPRVTTLDKIREDIRTTLKKSEDLEIVLMPLSEYEALVQLIEDLEDILDHKQGMEAYRKGKGRPFREFIAEYKDDFDL